MEFQGQLQKHHTALTLLLKFPVNNFNTQMTHSILYKITALEHLEPKSQVFQAQQIFSLGQDCFLDLLCDGRKKHQDSQSVKKLIT
ncbi:hypothetical protein PR048_025540 [Dryococelus australis]|uniref:Uncharacterized protein n=1 Tax=Dryococelus australis TaxID=614101 RepID=A0ABQ9GRQ8_9NEOP|nr:hypothetical protein PR048_025540 [Dryococelus australis]